MTIPRTGIIQAGNGFSSTSFAVLQAGVCTYSLSSELITLAPGGGTGTVTVSTQTGCVWSAVPGASWLTITSGASGTGSGSFTFNAAPGTTSTSFSGTITVMSQVLTVVVGSSVGTPGTGTVTVQGNVDGFETCIQGCRGSCCTWTWESGDVYVTIGGVTFGASYSGDTPTKDSLASALAAQMNGPTSPVSATVSGNVITIASAVDGAVTDYSLSTSYSFNTNGFSSPAFTGVASGAQLTGGTN